MKNDKSIRSRRIEQTIVEDLKRKMVLLAGPRQAGKTTLARSIGNRSNAAYYNWDVEAHRRIVRNNRLDESSQLWIFDELHKYRQWRNFLKGLYDLHHESHRIIVTGSGRLDLYSRGGDSLQGRYYFHRLHPFTLSEYLDLDVPKVDEIPHLARTVPGSAQEALLEMMALGGFPEPLLSSSERQAARWRRSYGKRIIDEDIRTLELIRDHDKLELLYERLPQLVGSILSVNSVREDLEVAFETVKNWLAVFERLYVSFRLSPLGAPRIKAVKKEQKLYLWDWARTEEEGPRFENLVALHLLRLKHWCEDVEGDDVDIRYFRDVVGHEVDFVVMRKKKPWMAVEVKINESDLEPGLKYLLARWKVPYAFQLRLRGEDDFRHPDINGCRIRILPAAKFLSHLP